MQHIIFLLIKIWYCNMGAAWGKQDTSDCQAKANSEAALKAGRGRGQPPEPLVTGVGAVVFVVPAGAAWACWPHCSACWPRGCGQWEPGPAGTAPGLLWARAAALLLPCPELNSADVQHNSALGRRSCPTAATPGIPGRLSQNRAKQHE